MLDDHVRSGSADGVLHGINNGPCGNVGHTLGSRRPDAPGNRIWFTFAQDRHGTIAAFARVRRGVLTPAQRRWLAWTSALSG
jgi:hypothetical protein